MATVKLFKPHAFSWHPDLPLSRWEAPCGTGIVYLILVSLYNRYGRDSQLFIELQSSKLLRNFGVVHNCILVVFSTLVFVEVTRSVFEHIQLHGVMSLACPPVDRPEGSPPLLSGTLFFWCWAYYISKYYELVDTLLLALRNKKIIPLHIYHHATMMPAMWACFNGDLPMSLIGCASVNSLVHIVMYSYYLLSLLGYPCPWKEWVTRMQLVQFVFGILGNIIFFWLYLENPRLAWGFDKSIVGVKFEYTQGCAGDPTPLFWTFILVISFLGLFSQFFQATYRSRKSA